MSPLPRWLADAKAFPRRRPRTTAAVLVGVLLLAGGLAYLWARSAAANEHWRQAGRALGEYDFADAREHLAVYLAVQPSGAAGHLLMAQTCRRAPREDFQRAEKHLEQAAQLGWPAAEVALESALLRFQRSGTPGPAEAAAREFLESRPDSEPLVLEALARGCIRADRLNKANAWLDRWVKNQPDDWYARRWRGALFQHMGNAHLAVTDYREVLRHRPDDPAVRRALGLALAASGYDYREAATRLERHLETSAGDAESLVALAGCYRILQKPAEARQLLEKALQNDPHNADALLTLAQLQIDLQEDEAALDTLTRFEQKARPFDTAAALARLLRMDPVAHHPHLTERREKLLHLRAGALRRLGSSRQADECLAQLRRLRDDLSTLTALLKEHGQRARDAELLYRIGELYVRLGNPETAENWLLRAVELDPGDTRAHRALAEVYRSRGTAEARERAAHHERLANERR